MQSVGGTLFTGQVLAHFLCEVFFLLKLLASSQVGVPSPLVITRKECEGSLGHVERRPTEEIVRPWSFPDRLSVLLWRGSHTRRSVVLSLRFSLRDSRSAARWQVTELLRSDSHFCSSTSLWPLLNSCCSSMGSFLPVCYGTTCNDCGTCLITGLLCGRAKHVLSLDLLV